MVRSFRIVLCSAVLITLAGACLSAAGQAPVFTVKWYGQSCLLITASDGTRILTDPYGTNVTYAAPAVMANLVTISHNHTDHNAADRVLGSPIIVTGNGTVKAGMVTITGYPSWHDDAQGTKRSANTIFVFQAGQTKLVHLGDLGDIPGSDVVKALEGADVVFAPVGEVYTMPVEKTRDFTATIKAKTVVPIHYSLTKENPLFGLMTIDKYLGVLPPADKVVRLDQMEIPFAADGRIIVLGQAKPE